MDKKLFDRKIASLNMHKKLSLKLLIDTKTNKVLFAEAGKEVIDFLFGLLALPIGTVINLLSKERMVGCIGDLYTSLEQLDESYLVSNDKKSALLTPPVFSTPSSNGFLSLPPPPVTNKTWYGCGYCTDYITDVSGTSCPNCNRGMSSVRQNVVSNKGEKEVREEGVVKGVVTYSIMDDLSVVPMSTISSITFLNRFQIKDLGSLKEKNIKLGMEEGLEMLKASLECSNVLTTVFLAKKQADDAYMVI